MAKNFIQPGDSITLTASGTVTAGTPLQVGTLLVVPMTSAQSTQQYTAKTTGVFQVTKVGSQAWTVGARVYWNGTAFTTDAAGNFPAGAALVATGSGSTETVGVVRLDGVSRLDEDT